VCYNISLCERLKIKFNPGFNIEQLMKLLNIKYGNKTDIIFNKKMLATFLYVFSIGIFVNSCKSDTQERGFGKSAKPQSKVYGADVFAWFPDGYVKKITDGRGTEQNYLILIY